MIFSYSVDETVREMDLLRTVSGTLFASSAGCREHRITRAAVRMDALTRDLLSYTKVATQKVELSVVDPNVIIGDVIDMNPALHEPHATVAIVVSPNSFDQGLTSSLFPANGNQYLVLVFKRRKADPVLQYLPEVSVDLINWNSSAGFIQQVGVADYDAQFETATYLDQTAVLPGQPRFIRLRIIKIGS